MKRKEMKRNASKLSDICKGIEDQIPGTKGK